MIALSFFDAFARDDRSAVGAGSPRSGELAALARRYMDSALDDWRRVLECESQFGSTSFPTPAEQSRVNRSLYEVYQKWAAEAEQVLVRTRRLAEAGCQIGNAEELEDAFGRVQARLKMTPEMFDRAREQIRQGLGIPMEKLRHELRARVRA